MMKKDRRAFPSYARPAFNHSTLRTVRCLQVLWRRIKAKSQIPNSGYRYARKYRRGQESKSNFGFDMIRSASVTYTTPRSERRATTVSAGSVHSTSPPIVSLYRSIIRYRLTLTFPHSRAPTWHNEASPHPRSNKAKQNALHKLWLHSPRVPYSTPLRSIPERSTCTPPGPATRDGARP